MKNKNIVIGLLTTLIIGWFMKSAIADDKDVLGYWLTEKKGAVIELYKCAEDTELCGRIAWLKKPYGKDGKLKTDTGNPDPSLRNRPRCGIAVVTGLKPTAKQVWKGGRVYDPKSGNRYSARIRLKDKNRLNVRVYLGIPIIGITENWSRPEDIDVACVTS